MVNDEDNRWSDDDISNDVEKMFGNKRRRNITNQIINQKSSTENSNIIVTKEQSKLEELKLDNSLDNMLQTIDNRDRPQNQTIDNRKKAVSTINKVQDKQPQSITRSDIEDIKHLLEDIVTVIQATYGFKKYPYDEKSRQAMEEGTAMVYKYRNYYDVINTIKRAGPIDPQDFDSPVYNAERIFEILERYSDILYLINDGIEPLFCVISHEGRTNFSKESIILPGEVKQFYNVYELRLRSPTVGHPYRVTEYMIVDVSETSFIPFELVSLHDVDLPSAGDNWLEEDIIPIHPPTTIRIQVAVSKTGIFSAAITNDRNTQVVNFNATSGPELIEDGVYVFELLVNRGDTINFRFSEDNGKIKVLRIQEIDASTA